MAGALRLTAGIRRVLADRAFTDDQIQRIIPHLTPQYYDKPSYLADIVDTWNRLMGSSLAGFQKQSDTVESDEDPGVTPPVAQAPITSLMGRSKLDITHILADVAPELLLMDPVRLWDRHAQIQNLGIARNTGEYWTILFHAPRGFYLQDWPEIIKKITYIEHHVIEFLYAKKELKAMQTHPLVKSAAVIERQFNVIRARYLFAKRVGYKELAHIYPVEMALDRPTLADLVAGDEKSYLNKFAPFCTAEEYKSFYNLISLKHIDEDDSRVFEQLAELEALGGVIPDSLSSPEGDQS